ncbi:MAG: preprotein translocase subunit SecG [Burkholderiales bacterium]
METLVWIVHLLTALGIIGLVLLQHGKGADMGAAFGGGASGGLFGATGAANFLSRATAVLVAVFFATSLALTYITVHEKPGGVMQRVQLPTPEQTPKEGAAPQQPAGDGGDLKAGEIPK